MNRSLKIYQGPDIRNVALVGHAHCGKTTLISALLQAAKMTERLGRVDDGSAVTAYDEEDVARRTTMQNALAFAEWRNVKINFVDTPGFPMFVHEARAALLPVEAALLVVNASCGVEAMTRRVWTFGEEFNLPRVIVINQMDHPRADRERTLNALREDFGRQVVPVQLPIMEGGGQNPIFRGVVDLVTMEAFVYEPDGTGRPGVGRTGGRRQRRINGGVFSRGDHPGKAPDRGPARGDPRRPHLPGAVFQRPAQCWQRPSAGLSAGLRAVSGGARPGCRTRRS
jgi:elongation factor G